MNINVSNQNKVSHVDPSFGSANIDQEIVNHTIDSLVQFLSQHYLSTVNEAFTKLKENPSHYKDKKYVSTNLPLEKGEMNVPIDELDDSTLSEQRYYAKWLRKIEDLDQSNPLDALLISLSKRITELEPDFISKDVDIRFEKGYLFSPTPYWHFDGFEHRMMTSISYSNKENWTTRVVDENNRKQIINMEVDEDMDENDIKPSKYALNNYPSIKEKLEKFSQPSKEGFFYHPQHVVHRAPLHKDLTEGIKANEYRLFLRFATEKQENTIPTQNDHDFSSQMT